MRLAGIKDTAIARALLMSYGNLQRIIRTVDYREYEEALLHGHLSKMDEKLAQKRDLMDGMARVAVPSALRTIIEVANQRKDLRSALAAAKDILRIDPDRTFAIEGEHRVGANATTPGLPASLFDSITKDADGVSIAVGQKLDSMKKGEAKQDA